MVAVNSESEIGIIEGFFGPEWSWQDRTAVCDFLHRRSGDFYIYAPKRDPYLRKQWQSDHPAEMEQQIQKLSSHCQDKGVKFGMGLSPFELFSYWDSKETQNTLAKKLSKLKSFGIDYLGLFFDDMKASPGLAEQQIKIVNFVQAHLQIPIIFCPTYYSHDPLLDKVFGQRSVDYLEKIGSELSAKVKICWTGNKVISQEISPDDLKSVTKILRRKPFIWDNFFANDGPKQCKFLKVKNLEGRTYESFQESSGWAFNLMNQANLSQALFLNSLETMKSGKQISFLDTIKELCSSAVAEIIFQHHELFTKIGLDQMDHRLKFSLIERLQEIQEPMACEILDWLQGKYIVGPECLTD